MLLTTGIFSFIIMAIGDVFESKGYKRISKSMFFFGVFLILAVTVISLINFNTLFSRSVFFLTIFIILTILFSSLLIYSLFFAIPFNQVYIDTKKTETIDKGIYGYCRHPGGIWFAALYVSLWLGFGLKWYVSIAFISSNFVYIVFQDHVIFPMTINGYNEYKSKVPFLIPNKKGWERLIKTIYLRRHRH